MSAFKKKCVDEDETLRALKLLVEFFADEKSKEEQERLSTALPKRGERVKKRGAKGIMTDFTRDAKENFILSCRVLSLCTLKAKEKVTL